MTTTARKRTSLTVNRQHLPPLLGPVYFLTKSLVGLAAEALVVVSTSVWPRSSFGVVVVDDLLLSNAAGLRLWGDADDGDENRWLSSLGGGVVEVWLNLLWFLLGKKDGFLTVVLDGESTAVSDDGRIVVKMAWKILYVSIFRCASFSAKSNQFSSV